jgi:hypothetical protein
MVLLPADGAGGQVCLPRRPPTRLRRRAVLNFLNYILYFLYSVVAEPPTKMGAREKDREGGRENDYGVKRSLQKLPSASTCEKRKALAIQWRKELPFNSMLTKTVLQPLPSRARPAAGAENTRGGRPCTSER